MFLIVKQTMQRAELYQLEDYRKLSYADLMCQADIKISRRSQIVKKKQKLGGNSWTLYEQTKRMNMATAAGNMLIHVSMKSWENHQEYRFKSSGTILV